MGHGTDCDAGDLGPDDLSGRLHEPARFNPDTKTADQPPGPTASGREAERLVQRQCPRAGASQVV